MGIVRDERGVILGWLAKIAIWVAIGGVILYDAAVLGINFFGLDSAANDIAVTLTRTVTDTRRAGALQCDPKNPGPTGFCAQAVQLAREADARLLSAEVTAESVVMVRLRRRAQTLLVDKIGFIDEWGVATADGRAGA